GAAADMDAYVAALAPPVVLATIVSGSLGYVLVPVIAERRAAGSERDATAMAAQIGFYLVVLSAILCGAAFVSARELTILLFPRFPTGEQELTASLLRVSSALIVFNSLIAYLNALFHSYRRFTLPAVAGVIGPIVTLAFVIAFHERHGIFAVAWGVV